jgi:Na+/proline symporter
MNLSTLDWGIIAGYCLFAVGVGIAFARRAGADTGSFFLSGRGLPWWLAGTSMVATSFASDTPLAVTGLVAKYGIAGNWLWWCFAFSSLMTVFFFSRLWRRARVVTDVELTELRYGGRPAAVLRGFKALYMAIPINCITMGWVILAMAKIFDAALGWPRVQSVILCVAIALVYSILSGLWGVVATDMLQFVLAMTGSVALAVVALDHVGGVDRLVAALNVPGGPGEGALDFFPGAGPLALPLTTFLVYIGVQWYSSFNADGGGIIIQRISAGRDERDSFLSTLWFCVAHYALRPWPWIVVALASLVVYPGLADPEMGYPKMMVDLLPSGWRGIMIASLLAAFMSTIDTHLNWGASYLVNDVYRRFLAPGRGERHYVLVSRLAILFMVLLAGGTSLLMESVSGAWMFLWSLGAGAGLVLILRWFWWRINAWSEIAAMVASLAATLLLTAFTSLEHGSRLIVVVVASLAVWLVVTFLTAPVDETTLRDFVRRVRPPGRWGPIAAGMERGAVAPVGPLLVSWVIGVVAVFALTFGLGRAILGDPATGGALIAGSLLLLAVVLKRTGD